MDASQLVSHTTAGASSAMWYAGEFGSALKRTVKRDEWAEWQRNRDWVPNGSIDGRSGINPPNAFVSVHMHMHRACTWHLTMLASSACGPLKCCLALFALKGSARLERGHVGFGSRRESILSLATPHAVLEVVLRQDRTG